MAISRGGIERYSPIFFKNAGAWAAMGSLAGFAVFFGGKVAQLELGWIIPAAIVVPGLVGGGIAIRSEKRSAELYGDYGETHEARRVSGTVTRMTPGDLANLHRRGIVDSRP